MRVMTTHLEYRSAVQRMAQAQAVRKLHAEACAQAAAPPRTTAGDPSPTRERVHTRHALLCGDFTPEEILRAARLLSHARCQVIAWNGTAAGWLGFERDQALCQAITRETGAAACTSVLALDEAFAAWGVKRVGLVSPYTAEVQQAVVANYARAGLDVVGERHLGLQDNFSFSEVEPETLKRLVREVAAEKPDAVMVLCTNLRGAPLVPALEAELGLPVLDSISAVVWKSLRLAGIDTRRIRAWRRLFLEIA